LPDARKHRGPDPRDREAFGPGAQPALRSAVSDLCWLLERGYAIVSALKLVGDRWSLTERQRLAVRRCACGPGARARRRATEVPEADLCGRPLLVDGFNVITTVEAALGGAVVLVGRDGCYRDLAGVHGTYRRVEETRPSLAIVAATLARLGPSHVRWLLDSPVSNSGRLRGLLLETASGAGCDWSVDLVFNPDGVLAAAPETVATADSAILDRCASWFSLARAVITEHVPDAWVIDLGGADGGAGPCL
jgi:hypothetical protein